MVATFGSMLFLGNYQDQGFDYHSRTYLNWRDHGSQGPRNVVARQDPLGLVFERGQDVSYFSKNFGNFANAIADVPPIKAGEYISRAANVKFSIDQFMVREYMPNIVSADLKSIYYKLRDYAKKKGFGEKFEIKAFSSGYIPKSAIAAVMPVLADYAFFFKNNRFGKYINLQAKAHKVSYEASQLYTMMHEFTHLFGVRGGSPAQCEATLEKLIAEFTGDMIKQLSSAPTYSEKNKLEITRILREIQKIAKQRYGMVSQLYSGSLEQRISNIGIEKVVSQLTKEAMYNGINTQEGIKKYVSEHLAERVKGYSKENGYNAKKAEKEKKGKKKSKKKKGGSKGGSKKASSKAKK